MAAAVSTPYVDDVDDEHVSGRLPFLNPPESSNITKPSHPHGFQLYTLTIVLSLVFLLDVAEAISAAPAIRILESILCHDYYKKTDPSRIGKNGAVEEKYCKIDPVQGMVAYLTGWDAFFAYLPGIERTQPMVRPIRLTIMDVDRAVFGNSFRYGS